MSATINVTGKATKEFYCDRIKIAIDFVCQTETVQECITALSDAVASYLSELSENGIKPEHKSNAKYERLVERHRTGTRGKTPVYDEQIGYRASQSMVLSIDHALDKMLEVLNLVKGWEYAGDVRIEPYVSDIRNKREALLAEAVQIGVGRATAVCTSLGKGLGEMINAEIGTKPTNKSRYGDDYDDIEPELTIDSLMVSTMHEDSGVLSQNEISNLVAESETVQGITELVAMGAFEVPRPTKLSEEVILTFAVCDLP
jgi:uncharacterized protein YggE